MNSLIIKGRLTSDPELKNTSNATEYCNFTVAVDRYAGKDKEKETDFIPCQAWRQTAVFVQQYFKKGQEILVGGEIRFDKYEKDGEKRTYSFVQVNRVEFCGGKKDNFQPNANVPQNANFEAMQPAASEDLPF